jgi:hypothetical protein
MSFDYKKVSATAGIFCLGGVILLLVNGMDEETIGKFFKKSDTVQNETPQNMFQSNQSTQGAQDTTQSFFSQPKEPDQNPPTDTQSFFSTEQTPNKPDPLPPNEPDQTPTETDKQSPLPT